MEDNDPEMIDGPNGRIACRMTAGRTPTLVWLGGYASDMLGTKAQALARHAAAVGQGCLRFDYTGHGESDGRFEDGTISRWLADSQAAIATRAPGPKLLVGSSMGGWIALLIAMRIPDAISGMVLIAPGTDFTEELVAPRLTEAQKTALERDGVVRTGTSGHPAETYTRALLEDGRGHRLLGGPIALPFPVRILHGMADDVAPTAHVLQLAERIEAPSLTVTLVKGGDHRLSEPDDIDRLCTAVDELLA